MIRRSLKSSSQEGTVIKMIHPQLWRIRFRASDWMARSAAPIALNPGDAVRVTGIVNITLLIEAI